MSVSEQGVVLHRSVILMESLKSCIYLLQIFFSEKLWMCFQFGSSSGCLDILKSTLWYLLAQHRAESGAESSPCTNPISPFQAVCGHLRPAGEKVHPQANTQEITTFLSCQTASHLHLQSRGCHLALCVGL